MTNIKGAMVALLFGSMVMTSIALAQAPTEPVAGDDSTDFLRQLQFQAVESGTADWGHWGSNPAKYSSWTNHSNRLIPVYTFGMSLEAYRNENSVYRDAEKLRELYDGEPAQSVNESAEYFDQTDLYRLQQEALAAGKKHVIVIIFDGMDWQTTQAAAIYRNRSVVYREGRGRGLAFLNYHCPTMDFGFCVTSPRNADDARQDVNAQIVEVPEAVEGGYNPTFGGAFPWGPVPSDDYLLGRYRPLKHAVTDSAASATSIFSGIKSYNAAINVDVHGNQVKPIARDYQAAGRAIGVVSSVPISHATPAATYANNVSRNDYQDLSRDLLGLRSIAHRGDPLPGVDVLIGCGWGETRDDETSRQGQNYVPGNKYLPEDARGRIDVNHGGKYVIAERTPGRKGSELLRQAADRARSEGHRLLGFFGVSGGHLPYQTADGQFNPTRGVSRADRYEQADVLENPTLAEMTEAALDVLSADPDGFWLMIEAGDVDWANHNNNIDDSIGAVFSGDDAFRAVTAWVNENSNWDDSLVIVTADHGHYFVLDQPEVLAGQVAPNEKTHTSEEEDSADRK